MKKYIVFSRPLLATLLFFSFQLAALGKVQSFKIPSVALSDSNQVIVASPTTFDMNKQGGYSYIVMLHGYSGNQDQWNEDADLQALSDKYNILLVLPDGGYDSWWLDTDLLSGRNYDTHLHQELTIWVVETLNGSANPTQHGIMGLSMGGFGAFLQALKHPSSYAAAASLSGVMDITRHPNSWGLAKSLGRYTNNRKKWDSNNPLNLTQRPLKRPLPDFLLICGRDDFAFPENQAMIHQMKRMGYSAELKEEAGAHTHTFWKTHVEAAIEFIVNHFQD